MPYMTDDRKTNTTNIISANAMMPERINTRKLFPAEIPTLEPANGLEPLTC